MFIAWAADRAGVGEYVGQFAWTPSHAAWFIRNHAWSSSPEPGALVFYDWGGGKSYQGIDHVGIVERVAGKKIHTIEANVERVWLKRKVRDTDKVVGYGLPRLVKVNLALQAERAAEAPAVSLQGGTPRVTLVEERSAFDFLGTPQALLAALVLITVALSLRFAGRRPRAPAPSRPGRHAVSGAAADHRVPSLAATAASTDRHVSSIGSPTALAERRVSAPSGGSPVSGKRHVPKPTGGPPASA